LEQLRDEILAGQAASGDMSAFEELVTRHRMSVYRMARSITGNHEDADDAAQEIFIRIFKALGTYDSGRPFKPWLKRIAFNTSLNVRRSGRTRAREVSVDLLPDPPDPSPGPDQRIDSDRAVSGIQKALSTMPAEQRATLLLRTVEGMSYADIARATGVRVGTVMSRLSRARGRIQDVLEKSGELVFQRGEKA